MPAEIQTVQQAYRFALDPTPTQTRAFFSHAGGARFAYNWGLDQVAAALDAREAEKAAAGEASTQVPSHFDLCKAWTAYKDTHADDPEPAEGERRTNTAWVSQNFVGTYQAALRDARGAWQRFFDSRSGKLAGRRVGRPRFKKKGRSKHSFQVHGGTLQVPDTRHVKLPKIGTVRVHEPTRKLLRKLRRGHARLVRGTVSLDSRGRWHIALTVEAQREIRTSPSARQRAGGAIGVDLGVRDLLTLSTGETVHNPAHLHTGLRRLAIAQRAWARTAKGSARRERARRRVARLHGRVAALRRDALSQTASRLIHTHDTIGVEGWDIAETLRAGSTDLPRKLRNTRNLALASAGLGELRWMLQSRAPWYGSRVKIADTHQETGRTCSTCGTAKTKPVPPAEELFNCLSCGTRMDRRVNSARTVRTWALKEHDDAPSGGESQNGRGADVRPATPRGSGQSAVKRQAGTRRQRRGQTGAPGP